MSKRPGILEYPPRRSGIGEASLGFCGVWQTLIEVRLPLDAWSRLLLPWRKGEKPNVQCKALIMLFIYGHAVY
jgi:hypothetical protein